MKESDRRKRLIADALPGAGISATIYDVAHRYRTELHRKAACLQALVNDIATVGPRTETLLVLEQDDTLIASDRKLLYRAVRAVSCADVLRYAHHRASAELLLTVPDAIAWCWAKGGDWRRRIRSSPRSQPFARPDKREARAPRSSGRVSGSLPAASAAGTSRLAHRALSLGRSRYDRSLLTAGFGSVVPQGPTQQHTGLPAPRLVF